MGFQNNQKGTGGGISIKKTWSVHQSPLDENQLARDILHRIATVLQIGPKYHPINMASNKF